MDNGSLKIIDRKANMFKLSTGDEIAPTFLENIYIQSEFVKQIFIYGDETRDYLIALIVVPEWAAKKSFPKPKKDKPKPKPDEEAKEGEEPAADAEAEA